MAENVEIPGQVPEDVTTEGKLDNVAVARRVKPSPRRGSIGRMIANTAITAGLVLGPHISDAPHQGANSAEIKPGHTGHELAPFREFTRPDSIQNVAVVPMFRKNETNPGSNSDLEARLQFVRETFANDSYGGIDFRFTTIPPQLADLPAAEGSFGRWNDIGKEGDKLLKKIGIPGLDRFQTRLYVVSPDPLDGRGGEKWKRPTKSYNQVCIFTTQEGLKNEFGYTAASFKHELGHTLGIPHANSVDASGKKKEYGGINDSMGDSQTLAAGLNAPQRVSMGWIGREQVRSIEQDGVYTLDALDYANPDKQDLTRVLRLQDPSTNKRIYISFRPQGSLLGGIDIHNWEEKIDQSPNEILVPEAMRKGWNDGDEFYDKKRGIRIKQISTTGLASYSPPESVQLQITFDKK